jgi:glycosyltransferase involved in cell wall biosynthesis
MKGLIEAFGSISDSVPHELVIVGEVRGFIDSDLDLLTSNVDARIIFLGHVTNEVLRELYASATALVFPSLYEGFGLPPLEAMAAGCPTICSNAASIPEVCGEACLYFDPLNPAEIANRMKRVAEDAGLANDLRSRGAEHIRGFSWDRTAALTIETLREQLAQQ